MSQPIPKPTLIGCLSGLMAGLVFVAPAPPCLAADDTPAGLAEPPLVVAESLLNQDPKPRPVMRHREEVPPSAVNPVHTPRSSSQAVAGEPTSKIKKTKKKKRKAAAVAPAASQPSAKPKAGVKAKSSKTKSDPTTLQTKKAAKKTPAKASKRKAKKDKTR